MVNVWTMLKDGTGQIRKANVVGLVTADVMVTTTTSTARRNVNKDVDTGPRIKKLYLNQVSHILGQILSRVGYIQFDDNFDVFYSAALD